MSGAGDLSGWRVLGWRGGAVVAINAKGQERALFRSTEEYREPTHQGPKSGYMRQWECAVCSAVGRPRLVANRADGTAAEVDRGGVEHLMAAHGMADPGELFDAPTAEQRIALALEQLVQAIQTRAPRGGGW